MCSCFNYYPTKVFDWSIIWALAIVVLSYIINIHVCVCVCVCVYMCVYMSPSFSSYCLIYSLIRSWKYCWLLLSNEKLYLNNGNSTFAQFLYWTKKFHQSLDPNWVVISLRKVIVVMINILRHKTNLHNRYLVFYLPFD